MTQAVDLRNPYPGLRPFEPEDAEFFFGRDRQVDELLIALRNHRFVAVLGLSGSGKSSLIRAGLIPALKAGHLTSSGPNWRIALFRPGQHPLEALAAAVDESLGLEPDRMANLRASTNALLHHTWKGRTPEENLLVVVDQFEETFRVTDAREAAHFVDLLLAPEQAISPLFRVYVVLTMRTDRLGESERFDGLPEALNRSQYLVPRLAGSQLREAIEGPAALTDTEIAPDLAQKLTIEAAEDRDQLPLLQHLLMVLWDHRQSNHDGSAQISLDEYTAVHSATIALNDHADQVLGELPSTQHTLAGLIFRALTGAGEGRDQRRPQRLSELSKATGADLKDVLLIVEHFRRASFLTSSDCDHTVDREVDITHESLIRQWKRLSQWVADEVKDADDYRYFSVRTQRGAEFLTGLDLEFATQWLQKGHNAFWAARYGGDFDAAVRYICESQDAKQAADRKQAADHAEEEVRKDRARSIALSILLGLSGWIGLFFSSRAHLISIAAAAVGAVLWTTFVGITSKIWARVEKLVVELVGDALDIFIRDFASRYRKRYLEHLQHRHRTFDVKGLSTQGIYALEIEQVYVELTVNPTLAADASANPIAKAIGGRHDIWTFLTSPQMKSQNLAILGAPGSGKTTLLKHLTLGLAANPRNFRGLKRLPVLLFMRDHAASIVANPPKSIADIAEEAAAKMGIPAPAGWFGNELARGRCLVMLDGLDEVTDPTARKAVADWLESQLQVFDKNRFLVTSRPFGYKSNPIRRMAVLEVRPFSAEQSERFINNWYLANEVMSAQKEDEGVRIAAREGAADLLKSIRATSALAELSVNPLVLTMIANVHRYRSSLPGRRVELYGEICEVFLGKRQQARGIDLDLTPAQKKRVLQPLAFHMMCAEKREISLTGAVQTISGPLGLVNDRIAPQDFLRSVENSSGLLLERENGVYCFAHLTFEEYLAASYIVEEKQDVELTTKVGLPWWHETIRLYVALGDATRIVEACIAESGVVTLTLAVECLEEALAVRPELRSKVESLVIAGLEDPSPELARLAAETKLALRLRRLTRVDDDRYIDNDLVSCAEYQLFIDERRAAGNYHQPDYWRGTHFPAGSARQPVLGIRPSDAQEFCHWLSERERGEWRYQIPESDLGGLLPTNASYWVDAKEGLQLCGSSIAPVSIRIMKVR